MPLIRSRSPYHPLATGMGQGRHMTGARRLTQYVIGRRYAVQVGHFSRLIATLVSGLVKACVQLPLQLWTQLTAPNGLLPRRSRLINTVTIVARASGVSSMGSKASGRSSPTISIGRVKTPKLNFWLKRRIHTNQLHRIARCMRIKSEHPIPRKIYPYNPTP